MGNLFEGISNVFLLAQVFGVITIALEFWTYQIKEKPKFFLVSAVSSFFWMAMFISIGIATGLATQVSLIVAATYSTIRNGVFAFIFKKNTPQAKEAGLIFLLVMIVIALIAGTLAVVNTPAQIRWLHILGMISSIAFVICQYLPGVHYVRIAVIFYAAVVLLTQSPMNIGILPEDGFYSIWHIERWNIMGMLIESSKIISVIVFYFRLSKNPDAPQLQFAKP
jgi:hypothetical protein